MCGATGEVRLDGRTPDITAVSAMAEAMAPRGPDSAGVWSQGRVALGHRRLKIIDLSEAGGQPMVDAELGLAVCWNGCIYNYQELRSELSGYGYRFFSHSDTEVLLKAYHRWGDGFVDRLYGMFAFAIVERDSGRVLLGRDRLGIKPLYLTETAQRIRFASSLPALLAGGGVDTRIDPVALHHYLTFHSVVPPPLTILRGVTKVPPASLVALEPAAAAPPLPTGHPTSLAATTAPTGPKETGRTPYWRPCGWRSNAGSSPTCRSDACCRAVLIPASSSGCSPRRASTG